MDRTVPAFNTGLLDLYPLFCGCEDCSGGHAFGPAIRDFFLIHYVRRGTGVFSSAGAAYPVGKGQCFLIRPHETTRYRADDADPWQYTWIAFSGDRATSFLRAVDTKSGPVFGSDAISAVFKRLYRMIAVGSLDGFGNELGMLSVLYALFAALPQEKPAGPQQDLYIQKVCNYVDKMLADRISIEDLAAYCGLDRHYLCRIFKRQTGFSLQEYVLGCKMRKARDLLLHSSLSVGDVARSVGYADPFNFSKMFKKRYAVSPARLRRAETDRS